MGSAERSAEIEGNESRIPADVDTLNKRPKKRIFVFLLLVTCVVLVGLAFLLWWVPYVGLSAIHERLPLLLAIVFGALVLFGLGGALTLVLTIIRGKNLFFNRRIRGVVIRILSPCWWLWGGVSVSVRARSGGPLLPLIMNWSWPKPIRYPQKSSSFYCLTASRTTSVP